MWNGKITSELRGLFAQYMSENNGISPASYEELCYDAMTYDEFIGYIKEALEKQCCIVDVVN